MKDLQIENGSYTRIVNPLIENLIKVPFKGCELAVILFIIRKTYGYNKTQDELSISQIMSGVNRSRQTVVTALKNLQLVNMARLVKRGNTKGDCNIWAINKYYTTWNLVNMARLVKRNDKPSLTERLNLVKTARHTKEITKETKDIGESIQEVVDHWNKYKTTKEAGLPRVPNKTAMVRLLPRCAKVSDKMLKAYKKLEFTNEEIKTAIKNYILEIVNRPVTSDYCNHRFSLYEFLKQDNGAEKFINQTR